MMRLASTLLVLTMLTTCAISGTFAKYVTQESGSDSARVAKFGVAIEAESFGMFKTDYETDDDTATFTGDYSVSSATGDRDDVLAPGTDGSFVDIAITGTPEVAVDVAIVSTVTLSDNWKVNDEYYCPINVKVADQNFYGLDYPSAAAFAAAIEAEINGKSKQYGPNEDLGTLYNNNNLDLSWSWAFEGTDSKQTNTKDTALGDAAVTGDLTISIGVAITVSQID